MMMTTKEILGGQEGFSFIEMIATLVIMGIIGAGIAMYFVNSVEGFLLARANNEAFQKMALAVERLAREMKYMDAVSSTSANSICYTRDGTDFCVAMSGSNVVMTRESETAAALIDSVNAFTLDFYDGDGNAWTTLADQTIDGLSRVVITLTVGVYSSSQTISIDINPLFNSTVNSPTAP